MHRWNRTDWVWISPGRGAEVTFQQPDWRADEPGVSRVVRATFRCNAAVPDRAGDPPQQVGEDGRNTCLQYRVSFNEHHLSEGWQPFWEQYRHPMMEEIVVDLPRDLFQTGSNTLRLHSDAGQRDYLLLGRVFLEETELRDLEVRRCPSWVRLGEEFQIELSARRTLRGVRAQLPDGLRALTELPAELGAGDYRLRVRAEQPLADARLRFCADQVKQRSEHRAGGGHRGRGVSDAGGHGDLRAAVAPAGIPGALPAAAGGDRPRQLLRVPQGAGRGARRFPRPAVPETGHPFHDGARGAAALDHRGQARRRAVLRRLDAHRARRPAVRLRDRPGAAGDPGGRTHHAHRARGLPGLPQGPAGTGQGARSRHRRRGHDHGAVPRPLLRGRRGPVLGAVQQDAQRAAAGRRARRGACLAAAGVGHLHRRGRPQASGGRRHPAHVVALHLPRVRRGILLRQRRGVAAAELPRAAVQPGRPVPAPAAGDPAGVPPLRAQPSAPRAAAGQAGAADGPVRLRPGGRPRRQPPAGHTAHGVALLRGEHAGVAARHAGVRAALPGRVLSRGLVAHPGAEPAAGAALVLRHSVRRAGADSHRSSGGSVVGVPAPDAAGVEHRRRADLRAHGPVRAGRRDAVPRHPAPHHQRVAHVPAGRPGAAEPAARRRLRRSPGGARQGQGRAAVRGAGARRAGQPARRRTRCTATPARTARRCSRGIPWCAGRRWSWPVRKCSPATRPRASRSSPATAWDAAWCTSC